MDPFLSSILNPVFQRVIDAAFKEYKSVRDLKNEIKKLHTMVCMINGLLEDAERKQDEHRAIRAWLKELKQVLFDAEDVFDEIATGEALGRDAEDGTTRLLSKVRFKLFSCLRKVDHLSSSRAIAHRVKDINERFDDISKKKEELKLCATDGTSKSVFWRPHTTSQLPPGEAHIIGRDGEMQNIKKLLLSDYFAVGSGATTSGNYKNVHVISVCGMGGLGKTTLVRHVYNDEEVENYFQLRMWVCVSTQFDVKKVTGDIMAAALSKSKKGDIVEDALSNSKNAKELSECSHWETVQNCLRDLIEGKRFLLVLDDVWDDDRRKWDDLCTPLMYGGKGSKIIVTTRSQKVASITKDIPIFLEHLSEKDLWSICQKYAFHGHDPLQYPELVFIGKKIVDNLKGSPLAANIIGQLLNSNLDAMHWNNIMKSKTWVSPDYNNSIIPILKLSYDYLPVHLKQCFAYCSLFSEDYRFDKDKLVQLWMAQQFIQIKKGFHLEIMGSEYFDGLVWMSLFEKCKYDQERYVMHDLIHNLADSVSEGDYLRLEDNKQNETISETIRHVSIASDKFDPAPKIKQLCNNMRTLLFLRGCKFQLDLDSIFMKLQRLRVLGLNGCNIHELPASIGTLKHLRFLDLSNNYFISELPDSLCNLHNLQVLNLDGCWGIRALPRNMSALINLRHLIVDNDYCLVSDIQGLGKLTALHELTFVCGGMQPMKELADMGMLRQLRITSLEEVKSREEAMQSRLDKKEHLDELELIWHRWWCSTEEAEVVLDGLQPPQSSIRRLTIRNYGGSRSPSWMEEDLQSCFLRTLELQYCPNWEVLPPLGQLLCLDSLKISRMRRVRRIEPAFMGCHALEGELPQGGFPSLQVLEFDDMEEWEEWEVFSEAPLPPRQHDHCRRPLFLARLRELTIRKCPKLRQLPPLPPTLTKLDLFEVGLTHLPEWQLPPSSLLPSSSSPGLEEAEVVLDGLQPPPQSSIRRLTIRNYGGSRSPSWMLDLQSCFLRTLELHNCPNWEVLPPLGQLLCLDSLKISRMERVRRIEAAFMGYEGFPSLQLLEFEDMEEWEEWEVPLGTDIYDGGEDDQVVYFSEAPLPPRQHHRRPLFLARLRELRIENCPKLRQLPPLPPTLTKLYICRVGLTHLPEWQLPPSSLPSSSSSSSPYSLSSLVIWFCPELTSLADGLLRHPLPNLVNLDIGYCEGLVSLPPDTAFGHLTSLKVLWVSGCPKLAWPSTCESPSVEEEEEDTGLPSSLERITIDGVCGEVMDQMMLAIVGSRQKLACLTNLKIVGRRFSRPLPPTLRRSLPSSLQQLTIDNNDQLDDETLSAWLRGLTSLRELRIYNCPAVTSLPREEVLSHLTALKKLGIHSLKALSSFGGGVHCLVSLEELTIQDCPELLDTTTTAAADSSGPSSSSALPSPARSSVGTSSTIRIRRLEISGSSMQQIKTWLLQCPSLQELRIRECPQLTGFGNGGDDGGDVGGDLLEAALLNLSGTLKQLHFDDCENLRSLPPGLRCLSSLQSLRIDHCPQIRSLPVAGLPASLQDLRILRCPALEERCKVGVGSDWPLISHIPTRSIGW